jgi:hypothetical protein
MRNVATGPAYIAFKDQGREMEFERYLKAGSGQVFARRHLW